MSLWSFSNNKRTIWHPCLYLEEGKTSQGCQTEITHKFDVNEGELDISTNL